MMIIGASWVKKVGKKNCKIPTDVGLVLADLHWLPVQIEYKIALITLKALTTQQPQYLAELVHPSLRGS